jgi:TPR repeat protein
MDLGAAEGAERMGRLYEEGRGVTKNHNEASKHYDRAIELGSPTAGVARRRIISLLCPSMRGLLP